MRKRLGEILVNAGIIDEMQLRSALAEAARWGKRIGEVLVVRGHCTEAQILDAVAGQMGVGVAPLATTTAIPPRVLRLLPPAFAKDKQALPLFLDGRTGTLEVAVADPAGYELLDELRFRTGHEIRPLVAMPGELAQAIDHFYFGAPRAPASARADASPSGSLSIELPETLGTPADDDDLFEHGLGTDDFVAKAARAAAGPASQSVEVPPAAQRPAITVQVKRSGPATGSFEAPAQSAEAQRRQPLTPKVAEAPANEIARLQMQVAELQGRLDKAYVILREAAIAHRALLAELAARNAIDPASLSRRVREQKQSPGASREGER
jgi:type IV pilus assembly protein PilB